jgi:hypothetical protein
VQRKSKQFLQESLLKEAKSGMVIDRGSNFLSALGIAA